MKDLLPIRLQKGAGSHVVLLHGLGNNYTSWTYVLEHFDYSKNTIIAVDLLGFGDAPKPKDIDYSLEDHAEAVIRTLDAATIKEAVIAGHSMGCLIAAEVARLRPDLSRKLILLGAPLFKSLPHRFGKFILWKKEGAYAKIFKLISKKKDLTLAAANGIVQFLPLIKGMEVTEETWPAFKKSLSNTIIQTKSYNNLKQLTVPTLLVYGILDLFVIKANLKRIARKNRHVKIETALGPHEITPVHGKAIAELIQRHAG